MGSQHILLVDHNKGRRNYAAEILRYCGYEVSAKPKLDLPTDLTQSPVIEILILRANLEPRDIKHLKNMNPRVSVLVINDDPLEDYGDCLLGQFTLTQLMEAIKRPRRYESPQQAHAAI